MFGEKVINLFCLFVCCDKVSFLIGWCWKLAVKSSKVKSCQPKYWVHMIWLQCALASSVWVCVFFVVVFFMGHWQLIPFPMEKQCNVDLVTSKAAKKEEAKTVFITGWHPSPNIRSFSLDLFLSTLNTFSPEKNKNEQS